MGAGQVPEHPARQRRQRQDCRCRHGPSLVQTMRDGATSAMSEAIPGQRHMQGWLWRSWMRHTCMCQR